MSASFNFFAVVLTAAVGCGAEPLPAAPEESSEGGSTGSSDDEGSSSEGAEDEPIVEFFASGSRLRAVTHEVAGLAAFSHWHDLELGVDCTMRSTLDGLRCLPIPIATLAYGGPECDIPLARLGCARPGSFVSTPTGGCSDASTYEGWRVGEEYVSSEQDLCVQGTAYEIFAAEFVKGSVMIESVGDVQREVVLGDDGSWSWGRLLNPESEVPCVAAELGGTVACRPANVTEVGGLFADSECKQPPVIRRGTDSECPDPEHGVTSDGSRVYVAGEEVPQDEVFRVDADGACRPVSSSLGSRYFVASEVGPDAFPAVQVASESGGRLQRRVVQNAEGDDLALHHEAWFDGQLDMSCTVQRTIAGDDACAPQRRIDAGLYSDDDCRTALDYRDEGFGVAEGTWVSILRPECGEAHVASAARRGGPYEGPVYTLDSGLCTLAPITTGMFELDPIVDYYDLAAVAARVD